MALRSGVRMIRAEPARAQGLYYVATGVWPIVHLGSFMALTGPKRDTWLVRTFGALVSAIGVSLLVGRADRTATATLAISSALTLAACEAVFVARGRISPIYLADALVEAGLAGAVIVQQLEDGRSG
jgi:energy-converting hydrogenase Eha subunit E